MCGEFRENVDRELIAHHGVWFAHNSFSHKKPDEIFVQQSTLLLYSKWNKTKKEYTTTQVKERLFLWFFSFYFKKKVNCKKNIYTLSFG